MNIYAHRFMLPLKVSLQEFPETSIRLLTQKDKNVDLQGFYLKVTHTHFDVLNTSKITAEHEAVSLLY